MEEKTIREKVKQSIVDHFLACVKILEEENILTLDETKRVMSILNDPEVDIVKLQVTQNALNTLKNVTEYYKEK
jgi:hypothetical protein